MGAAAPARETAELSISLICGYVGKAPEDAGKRATNSAAILQRGKIVFRQTKLLLPASAATALRAMQKLPHLSDSDVDELDAAIAAGRLPVQTRDLFPPRMRSTL